MVSKDKLPGIGGTQGTLVSTNRSTQHFMSGHTPGIDSVDTGNVVPFQQKAAPEAQQETQDPAQSGRSGRQPYSTATPCLAEGSLIEALQHPLAPGQSRALFVLRLEISGFFQMPLIGHQVKKLTLHIIIMIRCLALKKFFLELVD